MATKIVLIPKQPDAILDMSATRANGMKSPTGLRPCGKVGGPTRIGARPM